MHKGRLRESGTHQQLLALRGIYWKLYQLQYKDQELVPVGQDGILRADCQSAQIRQPTPRA